MKQTDKSRQLQSKLEGCAEKVNEIGRTESVGQAAAAEREAVLHHPGALQNRRAGATLMRAQVQIDAAPVRVSQLRDELAQDHVEIGKLATAVLHECWEHLAELEAKRFAAFVNAISGFFPAKFFQKHSSARPESEQLFFGTVQKLAIVRYLHDLGSADPAWVKDPQVRAHVVLSILPRFPLD